MFQCFAVADRLAVSDHNAISGALEMQALAPALVIVSEEIMTSQGELLGYFLRERHVDREA